MAGDGGQSPAVEETVDRWWLCQQWCCCSGIVGSNGEMGSHHGDEGERNERREREIEREREREREREKKK
ncbi:hypothetical protein VitviT2T_021277 [Vitis vinifera]|uniref:Uncharacterized protein n=1 Tax=Vitis vinifera TaxID=29760 RepID=A0ABY9D857_VITVI|nr:hypothetical protein VitviT2T_021277 [Vitis vinifera]